MPALVRHPARPPTAQAGPSQTPTAAHAHPARALRAAPAALLLQQRPAGRGFTAGGERQTATSGVLGGGVSPARIYPCLILHAPSLATHWSLQMARFQGTLAPTSYEVTVADRRGCLNDEAYTVGNAARHLIIGLTIIPA